MASFLRLWPRLALLGLLPAFAIIAAADSQCGSLVTYRQFEVLLSAAPTCFQTGCAQDTNTTSMDSPCPSTAPCSPLWSILRGQWQNTTDWCARCPDADVACRIGGWPILNATSACDISPDAWIFSNQAGCCALGNEPFELADWVGTMCNGSEWREPFAYYGMMATEDWLEWIEPWNWTVQPSLDSRYEFLPFNASVLEGKCPSTAGTLLAFLKDNATSLSSAVVEMLVSWLLVASGLRPYRNQTENLVSALIFGMIYAILHHLGNLGTSLLWYFMPGYGHLPIGLVMLLLFTRPSSVSFMCYIGIWSSEISSRFRFLDREPYVTWRNMILAARNAPRQLLSRWWTLPEAQPNDELLTAESEIKKTLEQFALSTAFGEVVVELVSIITTIWVVNTGRSRGFYYADALSPYFQGRAAQLMYAGMLMHLVFSPLTYVSLGMTAMTHLRMVDLERIRWVFDQRRKTIEMLSKYYDDRRQETLNHIVPTRQAFEKHIRMNRVQRILFRKVYGRRGHAQDGIRADPGFFTRQWLRVWNFAQCRRFQDPIHERERKGRTGGYNWLTKPRNFCVKGYGLVESLFRVPYNEKWSVKFLESRRERHWRQDGPSQEEFDQIAETVRQQSEAEMNWWRSFGEGSRVWLKPLLALVLCINYISQWLFWWGFVDSMGNR
jgi:hypothetical protein